MSSLPAYAAATEQFVLKSLRRQTAAKLTQHTFVYYGDRVHCATDFLSSFEAMNRVENIAHMSRDKKFQLLFGTDQIIP